MIDPVFINIDCAGAPGAGVPPVSLGAEARPADLRRPVPHPKPGAHSHTVAAEKPVARLTVQVHLKPAHGASGRVDIWLNGAFCGAYQGPMADRDYGARRNGAPFINAQPRFGLYRDWRAETQTIYFDKIMFWNADPAGHPDWNMSPPPG